MKGNTKFIKNFELNVDKQSKERHSSRSLLNDTASKGGLASPTITRAKKE